MKLRGRTDGNHAEIIAAVRSAGAFAQSLANIGNGCPDALVIYRGRVHLLEIKDGAQPPSKRKLTPAETQWHNDALARGYAVAVIESVNDALRAIGAMK